jgi:DNA-binding LytR/AlgR family response regulator
LAGKRVLVVEDEFLLADELVRELQAAGAVIVGPAPTVGVGLGLAESGHPDLAVLDINLRGQMVYPLADALAEADVPFIFATGYDAVAIPLAYAHVPRCEKPVSQGKIVGALAMAASRTAS